jgi:hypothetical protein
MTCMTEYLTGKIWIVYSRELMINILITWKNLEEYAC